MYASDLCRSNRSVSIKKQIKNPSSSFRKMYTFLRSIAEISPKFNCFLTCDMLRHAGPLNAIFHTSNDFTLHYTDLGVISPTQMIISTIKPSDFVDELEKNTADRVPTWAGVWSSQNFAWKCEGWRCFPLFSRGRHVESDCWRQDRKEGFLAIWLVINTWGSLDLF